MALRSLKISSDLVHTYKQCWTSTNSLQPYSRQRNLSPSKEQNVFKIKLVRSPESETALKHLQPAFMPKILEIKSDPTAEHTVDVSPFPQPFKAFYTNDNDSYENSDVVMPGTNVCVANSFKIVKRKYSMPNITTFRDYSRNKSNSNQNDNCEDSCKKKSCKHCPKCPCLPLDNCEQATQKACVHPYTGPKCKKVFAPYPSYSELCAERLPPDPSECYECPWTKCGGTDNIKPGKKKYHTVTEAIISQPKFNTPPPMEPCKRPPGICEEREKMEEDPCPPPPPKKSPCKKMCYGPADIVMWVQNQKILDSNNWFDVIKLNDAVQAGKKKDNNSYEIPCRSKREDCKRKKEPLEDCPNRCRQKKCPKRCHSGSISDYIYEMKKNVECPDGDDPCSIKSPSKIPVDRRVNKKYKPVDPCCENEKKGKKRSRKPSKYFVPDPDRDCSK